MDMSLVINQTQAKIGIERIPGRLDMQTQNPRLELHQKHAKVNIKTEPVKIEINQYKAFANAGLKNFQDLTKEAAQLGYQQAMEFIGKTAADGRMLAAIENGGNPLIDIAVRDAFPQKEFRNMHVPKAGPEFSVSGGTVSIEPEPNGEGIHNGVEGKYTPGDVIYSFTPTQVNIYMKQYNSISFEYRDSKVDIYI